MKQIPKLQYPAYSQTKYTLHNYGMGNCFWVYESNRDSHKSITSEDMNMILSARLRVIKADIATLKEHLGR